MPAGVGAVGTASNPSPQVATGTTGLKRTAPTPSSGGIIQDASGKVLSYTKPDPGYSGPLPTGFGLSKAQQASLRAGPAIAPAVVPHPPANRPPQTERANPLTNGGGPPQVEGTSVPVKPPTIDPGRAMGFSSRGNRTPAGNDLDMNPPAPAAPAGSPSGETPPDAGDPSADLNAGHVGGFGAYARTFSNPVSAGIYAEHVQRLFGGPPPGSISGLTKPTRGSPRDMSNDEDADAAEAA